MSQLHAMAPAPVAEGAPAPNPLVGLMPLVVIFALFYFLFIRPQQKQAKEREKMLKAVKEGDKVVLVSGVYATVSKVEDGGEVLRLQIADGVHVKAARSAVERLQK
jgi:preprotein translocase subunit YajC